MTDRGSRILIPSVDQIVALHDQVVARTGGASGIRSIEAIAGAWGRAETRRHYQDDVVAIELASTLGVSIAKAHGFVDGNKRAAYGALNLTLQMNGLKIGAEASATVWAMVEAAKGDGGTEDLEQWLSWVCRADPVYQALFDYDAAGPELT